MDRFARAAAGGALMLVLTAASAAATELDFRGSLYGDYNFLELDGGGDANLLNASADFVVPIGPLNLQGGAGYHSLDAQGLTIRGWHFGGAAFWRGEIGTAGIAITHGSFSADPTFDLDVAVYGAFGEVFAGDRVTIALRGGWFDGSLSADGSYWGGGLKFYVIPSLSVAGGLDYTDFDLGGHVTTWNLTAEWQVFETTPLSVYGGYSSSNISGAGDVSSWMIGLRWRFGDSGDGDLVTIDRTNAVQNTSIDFGHSFVF